MATVFTLTIDAETGGDSGFMFPGDRPYQLTGIGIGNDGLSAAAIYYAAPDGVPDESTSYQIVYTGEQLARNSTSTDLDGRISSTRLTANGEAYASLAIDFDEFFPEDTAILPTALGLTPDGLLNQMAGFSAVVFRLVGNIGNDRLTGSGRADSLDGRAGADTMIGRSGNDSYIVDNVGDRVIEVAGEGVDTVNSTISYTLGAALENLTLIGSGDINGAGNAGNNVLFGGAGKNVLAGGLGNDSYFIQTVGDRVAENANEGVDTVVSTITYTASANIENVILEGLADINATGNALANRLEGNGGVNRLAGGAGDDSYLIQNAGDRVIEAANAGVDTVQSTVTYVADANVENVVLVGLGDINAAGNALANILTGGGGRNTLAGGAGDDTYYIQTEGDRVAEAANEGYDTVRSTVTYFASANVEKVVLAGAGQISAIGNALDNVLVGNASGNFLNGNGGADRMAGGLGDDIYGTDGGDTITEALNAGYDTVESSVSYTLGANLEKLQLTRNGNTDATGNALENALIGNDGNNRFDGREGADVMTGRAGDDTYFFDNLGDSAFEIANGGFDTIISSVSVTVLLTEVERIVLTGTDDIFAFGNALANQLTGNAGDNQLFGAGGADTLKGNGGADAFVFTEALGATNVERIVDFSVADDTIWLESVVFGNLPVGALAADAFVTGTAAQDASDRIIHDRAGGRLLFDSDGAGAAEAVLFATIQTGLVLTAADFTVVAL